jgi:hypothetical protein
MDYKTNLENLLAAAYLSGAAEGLRKATQLTPDDVNKNLEDLKHLRRIFFDRAESEGYQQPVHHVEEAKKRAYELLVQHTKFPNTNVVKNSPPLANTNVSKPINTNVSKPINTNVSKAVNAVATNTKVNTVPMSTVPSVAPPVLSLGGKRRL